MKEFVDAEIKVVMLEQVESEILTNSPPDYEGDEDEWLVDPFK